MTNEISSTQLIKNLIEENKKLKEEIKKSDHDKATLFDNNEQLKREINKLHEKYSDVENGSTISCDLF